MYARKKEIGEQEALMKLAALCSQAEHSSGEMTDKMRRWQLPADAQERILKRLRAEKYVDDERFCRLFVRDKLRFSGWGPRKIMQALRLKGVAEDTAEAGLAEISAEEWAEALRPVIAAKRRTLKAASPYELRAKLMRFAMGRGFGMDTARQCIGGADEPDDCLADDDF